MPRPPPRSTPFPYTTLFRSRDLGRAREYGREAFLLRVRPERIRGRHVHRDDQVRAEDACRAHRQVEGLDRKSTRLNSSHVAISYAVFCLKKKKQNKTQQATK